MLMKKTKNRQTNRIIFQLIYLLQKLVEWLSTMKLIVLNKTALKNWKKLDLYSVSFDGPLKEMQAMRVKATSDPGIAKQER